MGAPDRFPWLMAAGLVVAVAVLIVIASGILAGGFMLLQAVF